MLCVHCTNLFLLTQNYVELFFSLCLHAIQSKLLCFVNLFGEALLFVYKRTLYTIFQVFERKNLTPGKFTQSYAQKQHRKRLRDAVASQQPAAKRKRLQLKQERAQNQGAMEAIEGATYEGGKALLALNTSDGVHLLL